MKEVSIETNKLSITRHLDENYYFNQQCLIIIKIDLLKCFKSIFKAYSKNTESEKH